MIRSCDLRDLSIWNKRLAPAFVAEWNIRFIAPLFSLDLVWFIVVVEQEPELEPVLSDGLTWL